MKNNLSSSINSYNNSIVYNIAFDDYKISSLKLSILMGSGDGLLSSNLKLFFILTFILGIIGALIYIIPKFYEGTPGIKHDNIVNLLLVF